MPDPGRRWRGFHWEQARGPGKKVHGRDVPNRVTVYLIESQTLGRGMGWMDLVERRVVGVIDRLWTGALELARCDGEVAPLRRVSA
jgi:hypothetical protein